MKALTLYQPWATLVALGLKKIETRSWATKYRGALAIHSSGRFRGRDKLLLYTNRHFRDIFYLLKLGPEDLPLGQVIATCGLDKCERINPGPRPIWLSDMEMHFGNYEFGRYMFFLGDIKKLEVPVPAKGMLGLWDWEGNHG